MVHQPKLRPLKDPWRHAPCRHPCQASISDKISFSPPVPPSTSCIFNSFFKSLNRFFRIYTHSFKLVHSFAFTYIHRSLVSCCNLYLLFSHLQYNILISPSKSLFTFDFYIPKITTSQINQHEVRSCSLRPGSSHLRLSTGTRRVLLRLLWLLRIQPRSFDRPTLNSDSPHNLHRRALQHAQRWRSYRPV